LAEKFFNIQRYVKKLETKIKRITILVKNFQEESRTRSAVCSKRMSLSHKKSRTEYSFILEDSRLSLGAPARSENNSCHNPHCASTIAGYMTTLAKLRKDYSGLECELQNIQAERYL
jgi:hypothetical protein